MVRQMCLMRVGLRKLGSQGRSSRDADSVPNPLSDIKWQFVTELSNR